MGSWNCDPNVQSNNDRVGCFPHWTFSILNVLTMGSEAQEPQFKGQHPAPTLLAVWSWIIALASPVSCFPTCKIKYQLKLF